MREEIIKHKIKMMDIVDSDSLTDEEKRAILLELFKQLKIIEDKQTQIVPNDFTNSFIRKMKQYFVNPTRPQFCFPDLRRMIQIEQKLKDRQPLSLAEVQMLLNWYCAITKINIFNYKLYDCGEGYFQEALDTFSYEGYCGLGSQLLLYNLRKIGLNAIEIDIMDFIPSPSHEIVIVTIPVEIEGKQENRQYLIDCTYRQFFMIFDCNDAYKEHNVGYYMMFEKEKVEFANQVLQNGFCHLTPQTAKIYFDGFYLASQGQYCFDFNNHQIKKEIVYSGNDYLRLINTSSMKTLLDIETLKKQHVFLDYSSANNIADMIELYCEYANSKKR